MKIASSKKKPAGSLAPVFAGIDADIATVVAEIVAARRLERPPVRATRRMRREPAHAA
jgi:hypothetical protein